MGAIAMIDKGTEAEIGRLVEIYAARKRAADEAHNAMSDYVWSYLEKRGMANDPDSIMEVADLIPKGSVLLLRLYDRYFELKERHGEENTE